MRWKWQIESVISDRSIHFIEGKNGFVFIAKLKIGLTLASPMVQNTQYNTIMYPRNRVWKNHGKPQAIGALV